MDEKDKDELLIPEEYKGLIALEIWEVNGKLDRKAVCVAGGIVNYILGLGEFKDVPEDASSTKIEELRKNPEFIKHQEEFEDMAEGFVNDKIHSQENKTIVSKNHADGKVHNSSRDDDGYKTPDTIQDLYEQDSKHLCSQNVPTRTQINWDKQDKSIITEKEWEEVEDKIKKGAQLKIGILDKDIHSQIKKEIDKDYSEEKK